MKFCFEECGSFYSIFVVECYLLYSSFRPSKNFIFLSKDVVQNFRAFPQRRFCNAIIDFSSCAAGSVTPCEAMCGWQCDPMRLEAKIWTNLFTRIWQMSTKSSRSVGFVQKSHSIFKITPSSARQLNQDCELSFFRN